MEKQQDILMNITDLIAKIVLKLGTIDNKEMQWGIKTMDEVTELQKKIMSVSQV